MNNTLDNLSVINDDDQHDYKVTLGAVHSKCLKHKDKFEFVNADVDPSKGFTFSIVRCNADDSESLTLSQNADGEWLQMVNGNAGPPISKNTRTPIGDGGPLFHLVQDPDQDGVVIVGTVDVDGLPTVARVGNREGLHA